MDTVVAKTGASGSELKSMQKSVENIASYVPTSFQAAGDAIGEVNTRFHLTGKSLESLSTEFIKFAEINGADVTNSVRGTQMVMSAFGLKTKDVGALLGVFTSVSQKTGVPVDALMTSLIQNGATFRDMGLSAQNAATLLGNFEAAGIDYNIVMGALKKAIASFQSKGIDVKKGLRDMIGSLSDGKVTTEDYNKAVEIFGKRGAELFTTVQGSIVPIIQGLSNHLKSLNEWWKNLSPGMQEFIVKALLVAAAVEPILVGISKVGLAIGNIAGGIGKMITIGSKLYSAFQNIGEMAGVMSKAIGFITSPVGIVIAAIAAAVAIGIILYKNWDKIKSTATGVFTAVKTFVSAIWNGIKAVISKVARGIKSVVSSAWRGIKLVTSSVFGCIRSIELCQS